MHYYWPGNVRELKNIAEQVSVLASDKLVTREEMVRFLPGAGQSTLPVKVSADSGEKGLSDREIMYKLLFDMRQDINDLKKFIWSLAQSGKIDMTDMPAIPAYTPEPGYKPVQEPVMQRVAATESVTQGPIILEDKEKYEVESVEESLSLTDMERDMILRALDKHKGRRRDAALELGISERTLYRKIKEYDIHA